jgi:Zn-dependent protease with chaperone function
MFRSRKYRVDNEQVVLAVTILLVLFVIILTSTATFCLSGVFIMGMFLISALMIRSHHRALMQTAKQVTPLQTPKMATLVEDCARKLQPGAVETYLVRKDQMNAYTFGISDPKVLVVYTPLISVMSPGELKFIVGHEMGHVALGHTWLNTIVGGLAGIPAPFGAAVVLYAAFRWWNRMCEFSADRAGLLACGDLNLAVSALVRLAAPDIRSQQEFERALAVLDAQDDHVGNRLAEVFQSHPMLIQRIEKLRDYARTEEYRRLQAGVNRNVGMVQPQEAPNVWRQEEPSTPVRPQAPEEPKKSPEERWPWLKPKDE